MCIDDAKIPLYHDSTNFTRLSTVLRSMNLKEMNEWIHKKLPKIASIVEGNGSKRNTLPT